MNNLGKLNDYLFEAIDRLDKNEGIGIALKDEIERAEAISMVAGKVIENGKLLLSVEKFKDEKWNADAEVPEMLQE